MDKKSLFVVSGIIGAILLPLLVADGMVYQEVKKTREAQPAVVVKEVIKVVTPTASPSATLAPTKAVRLVTPKATVTP